MLHKQEPSPMYYSIFLTLGKHKQVQGKGGKTLLLENNFIILIVDNVHKSFRTAVLQSNKVWSQLVIKLCRKATDRSPSTCSIQ